MSPLPLLSSSARTPPESRRPDGSRLGMALLVTVGAGLGVLVACGAGEPEEKEGPPVPVVESMVLVPRPYENVARFVGQLETAESVVLKPEISGVVAEVLFQEGEPVKQGEPLLRLRDAEQRALLAEAQAEFRLADDAFERSQRLAKSDARSEIELVRARGALEVARARLDLAEVQLARTLIRAPFDGVIGQRLVSTGERVSPGGSDRFSGGEATGIARIEALDRMELVFTVPETIAVDSAKGRPLRVSVASYPDRWFPGAVFFVGPRINAQNRRVLVKASIPNPEHLLRPGMFTRVEMPLDAREDALLVPDDAVRLGPTGASVWRVRADGTAEAVPVELGLRAEGLVLVEAGLAAGDEVIVSGTHKVVEGDPVELIRLPTPAPEAAEASARSVPTGGPGAGT